MDRLTAIAAALPPDALMSYLAVIMTSRQVADLVVSHHDDVMQICRSLQDAGCPEIQDAPYTNEQDGQEYSPVSAALAAMPDLLRTMPSREIAELVL